MAELPRTQYAVLALLSERGRMHAYEIKQVLKAVLGHSSVYAALSAVQAKGFVDAEWSLPREGSEGGGPPRKYFELTTNGREAVRRTAAAERSASSRRPRPARE